MKRRIFTKMLAGVLTASLVGTMVLPVYAADAIEETQEEEVVAAQEVAVLDEEAVVEEASDLGREEETDVAEPDSEEESVVSDTVNGDWDDWDDDEDDEWGFSDDEDDYYSDEYFSGEDPIDYFTMLSDENAFEFDSAYGPYYKISLGSKRILGCTSTGEELKSLKKNGSKITIKVYSEELPYDMVYTFDTQSSQQAPGVLADGNDDGDDEWGEDYSDPYDISSDYYSISISGGDTFSYTGEEICPDIVFADSDGYELDESPDYRLYYEDNIYPGLGKVIVYGDGDYYGTKELTFYITESDDPYPEEELDIADADVTIDDSDCIYDGTALEPVITIEYNGETLEEGEDYYLEFDNNIEPSDGEAIVYITGAGRFEGSEREEYFSIIDEREEPSYDIELSPASIAVGSSARIVVVDEDGDEVDDPSEDFGSIYYSVSNSSYARVDQRRGTVTGLKAGTIVVSVYTDGNDQYTSYSAETRLTIRSQTLAKPTNVSAKVANKGVAVSWKKVSGASGYYIYRNSGKKAVATVKGGSKTSWTDTSATKENTSYSYTVAAYSGKVVSAKSATATCTVPMKAPSGLKLANKKKGTVTATWSKKSGIGGFEVQYGYNSSFKKGKTFTVGTANSTSISGFKKKQTCFVRVRAYKKSGRKTTYSNWSSTSKITIKK
ncbi:MAG: fibronectin type III domain-containing protein [Lachnospiraceae bacterium]|nr:fibronectin type III domain-containing protein [Lachnospiraceae bacterium]